MTDNSQPTKDPFVDLDEDAIDITGLGRERVLVALYRGAIDDSQAEYRKATDGDFGQKEAEWFFEEAANNTFMQLADGGIKADYILGRPIKVYFYRDEARGLERIERTDLYDRNRGAGLAKKVIEHLRGHDRLMLSVGATVMEEVSDRTARDYANAIDADLVAELKGYAHHVPMSLPERFAGRTHREGQSAEYVEMILKTSVQEDVDTRYDVIKRREANQGPEMFFQLKDVPMASKELRDSVQSMTEPDDNSLFELVGVGVKPCTLTADVMGLASKDLQGAPSEYGQRFSEWANTFAEKLGADATASDEQRASQSMTIVFVKPDKPSAESIEELRQYTEGSASVLRDHIVRCGHNVVASAHSRQELKRDETVLGLIDSHKALEAWRSSQCCVELGCPHATWTKFSVPDMRAEIASLKAEREKLLAVAKAAQATDTAFSECGIVVDEDNETFREALNAQRVALWDWMVATGDVYRQTLVAKFDIYAVDERAAHLAAVDAFWNEVENAGTE